MEGDDPRDHEVVFELEEALRRFADVERGQPAQSRPQRGGLAMLAQVKLSKPAKALRDAHA